MGAAGSVTDFASHSRFGDLDFLFCRDGNRARRMALKAVSNRKARTLDSKRLAHRLVQRLCGEAFVLGRNIVRPRIRVVSERMLQVEYYFCSEADRNGADFSAGLARAEIILSAYPQSIRTFFRFGKDRVSGCNLFAVRGEKGLRILEKWQYLEQVRKKPWRLVAAFGPLALMRFLIGTLSLDDVFQIVSRRLSLNAKPVLLPFAEAAIDVDKPADLELAETILKQRA